MRVTFLGGTMHDDELATRIAHEAGSLLRRIQRDAAAHEIGTRELKDRGDRESQAYLSRMLSEHRPDDAVLSEEAADDLARLTAERVWIIDPLDGTREFSEGRHDWAVHVALWQRGDLSLGVVALPGPGLVLSSADDAREWTHPSTIRLAVSRSRTTPLVTVLAEELNAQLVPMGSAGYKAAAVVRGEVDAYVHTGGQYEWDSAAPIAVARAAGLFTSRIDGRPLTYNNENPYLPDLIVSNPHLADEILDRIRRVTERTQ